MINNFNNFKQIIQPFPHIVVRFESTCSYYWLADGCHQDHIPFFLGHALYMKAIDANKQKSDKIDTQTIADSSVVRTHQTPNGKSSVKSITN
jgi:transposase